MVVSFRGYQRWRCTACIRGCRCTTKNVRWALRRQPEVIPEAAHREHRGDPDALGTDGKALGMLDSMTAGERIGSTGEASAALRILMSAYACEPHRGSEPGIGWHWATRLARTGHHVWVLTRANNRAAIEGVLEREPGAESALRYYDLPEWVCRWKNRAGLLRLYYLLWQWGAYGVAQRLCREDRFDLVHHITFGVFRLPSFMAFLGLPFVFGPVGGGESAPRAAEKDVPAARLLDRLLSRHR